MSPGHFFFPLRSKLICLQTTVNIKLVLEEIQHLFLRPLAEQSRIFRLIVKLKLIEILYTSFTQIIYVGFVGFDTIL